MEEEKPQEEIKDKEEAPAPEHTGIIRNEQGQFIEGQSGNPKGRPKDSISITKMVKDMLDTAPAGQEATFLQILVKKILKKAVLDEDDRMINRVWNYVDGLPKQVVGFDADDLITEVKIEIKQGKKDGDKSSINDSIPKELGGIPEQKI